MMESDQKHLYKCRMFYFKISPIPVNDLLIEQSWGRKKIKASTYVEACYFIFLYIYGKFN
ncbi:hypothetical protein BBI00_05760 [Chryseobacterium arthrosphaerae]|uniref:Uncharacterized protein n=1 Tax=Chryseobacterium arthrosphaerae TaxID=651561 RepID=A0A1B8ZQL1_9FLAO|nr:hypothetical protein BBI00_05760 [Chryseobacterium arthrosphaerae]